MKYFKKLNLKLKKDLQKIKIRKQKSVSKKR